MAYVISGSLVPILFEKALDVPLFHIEDIYTTGMLAKQANIVPEHHQLFSSAKFPLNDPCLFRKYITSHEFDPHEMRNVWQQFTNPLLVCSVVN